MGIRIKSNKPKGDIYVYRDHSPIHCSVCQKHFPTFKIERINFGLFNTFYTCSSCKDLITKRILGVYDYKSKQLH